MKEIARIEKMNLEALYDLLVYGKTNVKDIANRNIIIYIDKNGNYNDYEKVRKIHYERFGDILSFIAFSENWQKGIDEIYNNIAENKSIYAFFAIERFTEEEIKNIYVEVAMIVNSPK